MPLVSGPDARCCMRGGGWLDPNDQATAAKIATVIFHVSDYALDRCNKHGKWMIALKNALGD